MAATEAPPTITENGDDESDEVFDEEDESELATYDFASRKRVSVKQVLLDQHLEKHRRPKSPDEAVKASMVAALKKNRFCCALNSEALENMVSGMEYFEFKPGDLLMKQGEAGKYFFVIDHGVFEEFVYDATGAILQTGQSVGDTVLAYSMRRGSTMKAKTEGAVWGFSGVVFRKLLTEHAKSHYLENRYLLDQINMFDGLSGKRKERIGHLALFTEVHEPGAVVTYAGAQLPAVYIVKSGKLFGKNPETREEVQKYASGDCFGSRTIMFGEAEESEIICKEKCELACVGIADLERIVGKDFANVLMRSYIISVMRKFAVFSKLPALLLRKIAESAVVQLYQADAKVEGDPVLAIVVDGMAEHRHKAQADALEGNPKAYTSQESTRSGNKEREDGCRQIGRGDVHMHPELQLIQDGATVNAVPDTVPQKCELVALAPGCRFAIITKKCMVDSLRSLTLPVSPRDEIGLDYLRKAVFVRKVPIFKELSDEQIDGLVASLVSKQIPANSPVFEQGTVGDAFYIIRSGVVEILIGDKHIRDMGPGASFGERALLFNEPRSATVKAVKPLEVWVMNQQAFKTAITESMRENLLKTIQYQGTIVTMKDIKHVRFIGAGSFGTVRLVEHKRTGLRYALKRIRKKADGEVAPEVKREVELLAENNHPFILHFVSTFESSSSKYILTELVTGGELHVQVLHKMGTLSRKAAQFYIGSLALTLETIHERNIVYRDLKPENVMLDQQGYIKLVDFGLAKRLDESSPRTYTVAGTVMYMAPEVVSGVGYGTECDIWSLGVMLFEFVTGELPFGGDADSEQEIMDEIMEKPLKIPARYNDAAGKKFIQSLLNKNVKQRLGAGSTGWSDVKDNKFFKQGVSGNLFSLITGRELAAPLVPEGEEYSPEDRISNKITESDAEELGHDESTDVGCRLIATFKKFDLNGDGQIDKIELQTVLCRLDPKTFTPQAVNKLFDHIDTKKRGALAYDDFVAWIVNDKALSIRGALRGSVELDCHG